MPPGLDLPPEPAELRSTIRREVLDGVDWQERFGNGLGVGDVLWAKWASALEPAGMDRESFDAQVRAYRRELWFWVLGDRLWEQAISGLAGRVLRRALAS